MARIKHKRKKAEDSAGDETLPARQNKTRRTRSAPFPTAPESPNTAKSPSPEPSKQHEEEQYDTEEADTMSKLAVAALKLAKKVQKERLEQDCATAQKELALTKNDLENVRFYEKILLQSRDKAANALADANKRTETAQAEVREALLANSRLDNKYKTLEGRLKRADAQVEKLQRDLTIAREEKEEMEKLLGKKTAMEMAKGGDGVAM